ncbi:MAG: nicotinate-nucleotide adenylyltransferase [Alphaproteobacteria bacterium]|nr:nicotinate-nucleotide adenylyltransferase [Alphaproteobacteria bacterium]
MGGSFNPPHEGHGIVAATALKRLRLDSLWWLVTPGNPLKSTGALAPLETRLEAVRKLARHPGMQATGLEADLGTPYTAETVKFLIDRFSNTRFVWVMGADNLADFHRWRRWRDIAASLPIAVVDRPGWRLAALSSPAAGALARNRQNEGNAANLAALEAPAWVFLTARLSPQSSTALRNQHIKL